MHNGTEFGCESTYFAEPDTNRGEYNPHGSFSGVIAFPVMVGPDPTMTGQWGTVGKIPYLQWRVIPTELTTDAPEFATSSC